MADTQNVIITKLQQWARDLAKNGHIDRAYVFGSLIYDGGTQFMPSSSDVDLLLRIPPSLSAPLKRLDALDALVEANQALETVLFQTLPSRTGAKPITSITPVTEFELRFGVHKGGKPEIYSANSFLDLLHDTKSFVSLARTSPLKYEDHRAGVAALEGTQNLRNRYIAVAPNSSRSVFEWSGDNDGASQLALPKDVARAAAQLRHYRDRVGDEDRFDLNRGIDTLHDLFRARENDNEEYKSFLRWLGPWRGGPGEKRPLSSRHQMLLWEVLASAAEKALVDAEGGPPLEPGERVTQSKAASTSISTPTQLSQPDVIVFDRVIKTITTALALDSWSWFVDHAVRELVHRDFFGARGKLNACLLSTIWPEKPVELVDATKDVIESFSNYITYYETNAEQRESFFGPNKAYKRFWNRRFDEFATFEEDWSNHCYWLLCKFVLDLNRFADMVRKHVEPMFFRERGYFLVEDTMGFRSGLTPTLYRPTADAVELGLRKYPPPTPPAPLERDSAEAVISVRDMWLPPLLVDDTENKKAGTRRTVRSAAADAPKSEPRSSTGSKSKLSRAEGSSKKTTKSTSTKAGARRTVRPVATNAPTSEPRNRAGSKSKLSRAGGSSKKTTKSTSTKTRANSASTKATKSKSTRKRGS